MNDKTDNTGQNRLFYDGTCSLCCRSVRSITPFLRRCGVVTVPFENGATEPEMRLQWHDGRVFGGADAAIFLAGRIWWSWPLFALAHLPGIRTLLRASYRRLAANRHCVGGRCELPHHGRIPSPLWIGWLTTTLLTTAAWLIGAAFPSLPDSVRMWLLAGSLWLGFKILAWTREPTPISPLFALWVGMDAGAFANPRPESPIRPVPFRHGFVGLVIGSAFVASAFGFRHLPALAGTLTMAGLVASLHFGLFHLMAGFWQRLGHPVAPIMREPWRAASLAELWGSRWNRAFSDVARIALFRPLVRRLGVTGGTLAGFLASGLAHELVISLPARAGYGLPTLYFLIQGFAVLIQRHQPQRFGRVFTWLVFLAPAPLLFHPAFLKILTPSL